MAINKKKKQANCNGHLVVSACEYTQTSNPLDWHYKCICVYLQQVYSIRITPCPFSSLHSVTHADLWTLSHSFGITVYRARATLLTLPPATQTNTGEMTAAADDYNEGTVAEMVVCESKAQLETHSRVRRSVTVRVNTRGGKARQPKHVLFTPSRYVK